MYVYVCAFACACARAYKNKFVSVVCLCCVCIYWCVCVCVYTETLCNVLVLEHARQAYFTIVGAEEPRHLLKGLTHILKSQCSRIFTT